MIRVVWTEANGFVCSCCREQTSREEIYENLNEALTRAADLKVWAQLGQDITYVQVWEGDTAIGLDNQAFERRMQWSLKRIRWEESREERANAHALLEERGCNH